MVFVFELVVIEDGVWDFFVSFEISIFLVSLMVFVLSFFFYRFVIWMFKGFGR